MNDEARAKAAAANRLRRFCGNDERKPSQHVERARPVTTETLRERIYAAGAKAKRDGLQSTAPSDANDDGDE